MAEAERRTSNFFMGVLRGAVLRGLAQQGRCGLVRRRGEPVQR
jgi:hypothetical protein